MKDQVFMSPNNAAIVVGIPLFRFAESETITTMPGYHIALTTTNRPLAYIMDADQLPVPQVLSAEWVEKNLICLGDL